MVDPIALRGQAECCFRLADSITDPEMVTRLQQMGQGYEEAALRAEYESQNADADAGTHIDDDRVRPSYPISVQRRPLSSDFADQETTGCGGLKGRRHG